VEAGEAKEAAEAVEAEKKCLAAHQCIPKRLEPQN